MQVGNVLQFKRTDSPVKFYSESNSSAPAEHIKGKTYHFDQAAISDITLPG